jgi:hypothetical protein
MSSDNEVFIKSIYHHKLYVGNIYASENEDIINQFGIRTIISLSEIKPSIKSDSAFVYHHGVLDVNSLSKEGFILMTKIINKSLSHGNPVLIQCDDGLSNSIILALFYLLTIDNGLSGIQKYDWLKRKIPEANLEHDTDTFSEIQTKLTGIYTVLNDEIKFREYCKTILSNV